MTSKWVSGPVTVEGETIVEAVYDPAERWNGWLAPRLTRDACVTVIDALNAYQDDDYRLDYRFEDDVLVVVSTEYLVDGVDNATTRYEPDTDGLYALGAWSWTWSEAETR